MVRLGDVCEVRAGANYKDVEDPNGQYPIYGTGGIMGRASQYRCPAHSIIVGRKGTLDNPFLVHEPFWNIDTCFGVVPSEKIIPEYLFRFCQGFDFYSLVPASGRPSTTSDAVRSIEIPLPSLSEQKEIVARLERELAAVEKMKKGFEALAETAKAEFKAELKEVFEEISREGAKTRRLGDVCENLDSRRVPITKSNREAGKYPYYGASGVVDWVSGYIFDGDYLLVSEDGANLIARSTPIAFSVSGKIWVNNHAHILAFSDLTTQRFVEFYFASIKIDDLVTGAAQPKLTQNALNSIEIPLPHLSVQREVVARLDVAKAKAGKLEAKAREGVAVCETMRKAILKEAFE
jgi:type I restriction enzyme S subunit